MNYKDIYESKNFNPAAYGVRAVILYLREMFKANPDFEYKVYEDELSKSDSYRSLLITSKFEWESQFRSKRPAIVVSRGNLITGVNGTQGQGKVLSITENGKITTYSDLTSFPIVIDCLSESDTEAEVLSAIVLTFLSCDTRPIRSLGLQIQGSPTQTPAQIFERGNTSFISSVILQTQIQRQFKATVFSDQVLKNIELTLNSTMKINIK